jgi:hypothetical protein
VFQGANSAVLPSFRRRKQPLASLLLVCALLLAQTLLAAHGIEHLAHADEELCEVCLAGAPLGAALGAAPLDGAPDATPPVPRASKLTRPALQAPFNPHPARAPPHADAH